MGETTIVDLKEFYHDLSASLEKRQKEFLTAIEEQKRKDKEELDKIRAELKADADELSKQRTNFMEKFSGSGAKPAPELNPTQRISGYIRSLYASKGDPGRMLDYAKKAGHDWLVQAFASGDMTKALSSENFTAGGAFVPEQLSTDIIEFLRARSVIRSLQPMIIPMPNGTATIPKLTGGATAAYVGESTVQNATQATTGQLRLVWKKLRATEPLSREFLQFSSPGSDTAIRDDLVNALATAEDSAFIRGLGVADGPKGLRFWAPAANVAISAGADDGTVPTLAEVETDLTTLIQLLAGADVRMLRPAWIMSPRSKNFLFRLRDGNGNLAFPEIRANPATLWGFPVGVSNNVPSDLAGAGSETISELYLVDMADAVIGEATQMEIRLLEEASYTDSGGTLVSAPDRDEVVLIALERHDFGMRHDASVAVRTSVVYGAL